MTAATLRMTQVVIERGQHLDEEIAWLRSFGWDNRQIGRRLGITVDCIDKRDQRREGTA